MTSAEQVATALNDVLTDLGSDASRRSYGVDWNRFAEWLAGQEIDPLTVTPKVIRDHVIWMRDERKLKRGTIGKALSTIREIYRALVNAEAMTINPARETKPPKMDNALKTPVLTEEQTRTLLSSLPCSTWRERRDRLVLLALFGLGFRRAEIARIHTRDFDGNVITATVKGSKTITVAVPDWLLTEFRMWRISAHIFGGPMFPRSSAPGAKAISGAIVYEIVTDVAKKAGFAKGSVTPHCMRRTNITIAGEKGVSLKARQLAVGHSNSATTERYDKARDARREAPGNAFAGIVGAS